MYIKGVFEEGKEAFVILQVFFFYWQSDYCNSTDQCTQIYRFISIIKNYQACVRTIVVRSLSAKEKFQITGHTGEIHSSINTTKT